MSTIKKLPFIVLATILCCSFLSFTETDFSTTYTVKGRTEIFKDSIILIGSASSVNFTFKGKQCSVVLKSGKLHHGYIALEIDGKYIERKRIESTPTEITVDQTKSGTHTVAIYKATEAANGNITFLGATGDIKKTKEKKRKKIEFIGDSITCGMGNDLSALPCGEGEWFDQHNAYYSYAPIAARALNADYLLSSVSGFGMYRNWNDEHDKEAIIPDVYNNLYLNTDTSKPYDFSFMPDVVCIALGTNDFSEGDKIKPRLPFNENKYIDSYIKFIRNIYTHYPHAKILLLNSPMVSGEKNELFVKCLTKIKDTFNNEKNHKPISVFKFTEVTPHGCGYHPEIEDDKLMASQLTPFLQKVINE